MKGELKLVYVIKNPDCAWCADPNTANKCLPIAVAEANCDDGHVIDLQSSEEILESKELSPESSDNQFVQISPQNILVKTRPKRPVKVEFQVAHAKQFPIDLYFLMDLSWSMRDSRENLAKLGGKIIEAIKERTKNLATGFGSFIEKNVQPFTSAISSFNCNKNLQKDCTPPYSFYHKSVLKDITPAEFSASVLASPMAGNVDDPEGSLDALMQVMVCGDRIGWRKNSRKIIILSTDRDYHFALDGKLAGIFTPNDGKGRLPEVRDLVLKYISGILSYFPAYNQL